MKKMLVNGSVAVAALTLASGCAFRAQGHLRTPPPVHVQATVSAPPPPSATVTIQAGTPQLAAGVQVMEASCTPGAPEICNGIDDNCNGQIDEGCGYQSGNIQITLSWNSGADIDMYVTDPTGETLSYSHTQSASGGMLDQDARGRCNPNQPNNTIENVFWNTASPPSGAYQVALHYWGECDSGAGPTETTVSISVGGSILGAYRYTLSPNQRVTVATFNIP